MRFRRVSRDSYVPIGVYIQINNGNTSPHRRHADTPMISARTNPPKRPHFSRIVGMESNWVWNDPDCLRDCPNEESSSSAKQRSRRSPHSRSTAP